MIQTINFQLPSLLLISFAATALVACNGNEDPEIFVTQGERKLGIHVTEAEGINFDAAFQDAKGVGMEVFPQTFYWTTLEQDAGQYDFQLLDIANLYYPANDVQICFNLTPIVAVDRGLPTDLMNKSFSDQEVIDRFQVLLDSIHSRTPDLDINNFLFGNEVDLYFSQHPDEWDDFKIFYDSALFHVKKLWGSEMKVGVEATLGSMMTQHGDAIKALNEHSDMIAFTYYPLEADFTMKPPQAIFNDLNFVVQEYPTELLFLEETGYASSEVCNSSEIQQREFVENIFRFWDEHHERLLFVGFLWLHDLSEENAQFFVEQYGMLGQPNENVFKEYLRSTGLKNYDGSSKAGFEALKEEAGRRGF